MKGSVLKGYLFAIISAVIYGCMPLMASYIYADGVTPATLVFLRNLLALPSLAIMVVLQKQSLKIPVKTLAPITVIALFGCTLTPLLLFSAYRYMASGTATVFHFAYPAIVVLAGILFLKKKASVAGVVSVVLCMVGVALFYDPAQPINLTGSALALGSGCTFAVYVLLLGAFRSEKVTGFLFSFYVAAASAVLTLVICLATDQLSLPSTALGWGLCLFFATVVTTCAVVLFQQATRLIGGEKTSVLSTLEPITSIVVGVLVFKEVVGLNTFIGSVLVIAASVVLAISDMKKKTAA